MGNFARVSFSWPGVVKFQTQQSGNKLRIVFDEPVGTNVSSLTARLAPHVTAASLENDGKTVVLTMDKPYRTRSFVSGKTIGIDLMNIQPGAAAAAEKKKPEEKKAAEKKAETAPLAKMPTPAKAAPAAGVAEKAAAAKKVLATATVAAKAAEKKAAAKEEKKAAEEKLAAKKNAAEKAKAELEQKKAKALEEKKKKESAEAKPDTAPKSEPPAAANDQIMTTKTLEPQPDNATPAQEQIMTTKMLEATPNVEGAKKSDPKPAATVAAAPAPATTAAAKAEEAKPAEAPAPIPTPTTSLDMKITSDKGSVLLQFPWTERVASLVFRRNDSLWIIFSKPVKVNQLAAIKALNDKQLMSAEQFNNAKLTMIRLNVSGKFNAKVTKDKQGFGWTVDLSKRPRRFTQAVPLEIHTEPPLRPHLMVPVIEHSDVVTFVDPEIGDEMMLVPFYKPGQGVYPARKFVECQLPQTSQGLVVIKTADDTRIAEQRDGLKVTASSGLTLSKELTRAGSSGLMPVLADDNAVFYPFDRWKSENMDEFYKTRAQLQNQIVEAASDDEKNAARLLLAQLFMGQEFFSDAQGLLEQIRASSYDFYAAYQLAGLHGINNFMMYRPTEALNDFSSIDLADNDEADLWKNIANVFMGNDEASFDFMANDQDIISKYSPQVRQRLAIIAADHAINIKNYDTSARIFNTLNRSNILAPIADYMNYMIGRIWADAGKPEEAIKLWQPLTENYKNPLVRAQAIYRLIGLEKALGKIDAKEALRRYDLLRIVWRGDSFELELLNTLGKLYVEQNDYINGLRAWRELVTLFPNSPTALETTANMAQTFNYLFNDGGADKMEPLQALALYREFRELEPIGEPGDRMVRNLADRLVSVDLLDDAAAILSHQVRYRLQGPEKSRVGARLALIHLMNKKPDTALEALDATELAELSPDLEHQRKLLRAQAYSDQKKYKDSLKLITQDFSETAQSLKLNIYWKTNDWPNVISTAEDLLNAREDANAPLTPADSEHIMKLALAYVFENNSAQLKYLRDYYGSQMAKTDNKDAFFYITDKNAPVDYKHFNEVAQDISKIETFMQNYSMQVKKEGLSSAFN